MTNRDDLKSFFAGYFHEDWHCEARDAEAVVDLYLMSRPSAMSLRKLSRDIRAFVTEHPSANDEELEQRLFRDLGCYYSPSSAGKAVREWLEEVAAKLDATAAM